jgi:glycosyltransferase involved in cell wall biosynthesis
LTKDYAMTVICIDCRYIGPRPSGIAEAVQAIVDHAPGLAPDLQFLLLRSAAHPSRLSTAPNVREIVLRHPANGPATMWWLSRIVDLSSVDLFHAPFNILPAGLTMPTVTTIHDMMWMDSPELCNARRRALPARAFFRHGIARALASSAAITTVSGASRDAIAAWSPEAGARTHVTLSGVADDFRPMAQEPGQLEQLGIKAGQRFVLTVGQYAPYKNHEGAVRGFARAFGHRGDIDLILVQRIGAGGTALRKLADQLGIGDRVHILNAIARLDLIALYNGAAALLHPSFCEGFGNPLAEAMACGCPIVTSSVSAMPEVTAGAARYADPNDVDAIGAALAAVVDDDAEADRLRQLGFARASQLSWCRFAQETLNVYRHVLSERAAAR